MKTYRGAGIAFFRQKDGQYEVFLGKRKYGIGPFHIGKGKWSFPGGGMDARDGADFLATAKRETSEEMGVDVDTTSARACGSIRYRKSAGSLGSLGNLVAGFVPSLARRPLYDSFEWETFIYLLDSSQTGDDFRFHHEMDPWGWFPLSSLPAMQSRNELFDFMGVSVVSAVEKFKTVSGSIADHILR